MKILLEAGANFNDVADDFYNISNYVCFSGLPDPRSSSWVTSVMQTVDGCSCAPACAEDFRVLAEDVFEKKILFEELERRSEAVDRLEREFLWLDEEQSVVHQNHWERIYHILANEFHLANAPAIAHVRNKNAYFRDQLIDPHCEGDCDWKNQLARVRSVAHRYNTDARRRCPEVADVIWQHVTQLIVWETKDFLLDDTVWKIAEFVLGERRGRDRAASDLLEKYGRM